MKSIDPEWKSYGSIDDGESGFPADLKYSIKPYRKNEIMFRQGSICDALYILTSGSVKTEMITETGNIMGIELIKAPRPLAPAFLFSDNNRFPVDVTALEECEILRIPKEEVMRLMAIQPDFMQQFLKHNANRASF
jgi:CRP-like cAMP-binding protein